MKINTTLGLLAGKLSGSILEKMGRGSTLPGKVALKFDKDILSQLAKNYEIVVITGTNGKTLTTALTVGILQEAFGPILTNPSGANMISGITGQTFEIESPYCGTWNRRGQPLSYLWLY